jgi:hypothetical protein
VLCDWQLSIIRPYLHSLLPENTINSGRFITDILNHTHAVCASVQILEGLKALNRYWWMSLALKILGKGYALSTNVCISVDDHNMQHSINSINNRSKPADRQANIQKRDLKWTDSCISCVCMFAVPLRSFILPRFLSDFIDFFHLLASFFLRVFLFDPPPLSAVLLYCICSTTVLFLFPQHSSFIRDFIDLSFPVLLFSCNVLFFA